MKVSGDALRLGEGDRVDDVDVLNGPPDEAPPSNPQEPPERGVPRSVVMGRSGLYALRSLLTRLGSTSSGRCGSALRHSLVL
ncbi:MAG: hypothetical protein QXV79_02745 [Thermofilaceae archaeon]